MLTRNLDLGYLAAPDAAGAPGVVMVHDVWGLADHTRDLARRLADEGFAVLAVNLYRRTPGFSIEDAGQWMRDLSDPQALDDIQAAAEWLRQNPSTACPRTGVTGFCMGGMYALLAACSCPAIEAAVPYYGILSHGHGMLHAEGGLDPERKPREPIAAGEDLHCPLLGLFGEEDTFIPMSDIEALRASLERSGQPAEVRVYPGAGHAFMNDTRPDAYRPDAAADAWARTVAFLKANLA